MTVFWLTLVTVVICGYIARGCSENIVTTTGLTQSNPPNKFFAFIALAVLVLVAGLRMPRGPGVIGDTGTYSAIFMYSVPDSILRAFEQFTLYSGDSGFEIFQSFIKEFISTDPQVFLFICAFITNLFIFIVIYKYSAIFELSLCLYITTGIYLVTMNGIRQCLVSAIIFFCIKLITDGKWLPFFIIVLLISTMHTSGLIFIPVYFLVRLKPWSIPVTLTLIASVLILLSFEQIGTFLVGVLEGTQYGHYQEYILSEGGGANIIRTIIAAVPVVLAYIAREEIANRHDMFINILINFSVLNLIFYILAAQNWIFARMNMYFSLYGLIFLPWLIKNLFDKKTSTIAYVGCIICYFIYYYYEMVPTLNIVYQSDFIGL